MSRPTDVLPSSAICRRGLKGEDWAEAEGVRFRRCYRIHFVTSLELDPAFNFVGQPFPFGQIMEPWVLRDRCFEQRRFEKGDYGVPLPILRMLIDASTFLCYARLTTSSARPSWSSRSRLSCWKRLIPAMKT